MNEPTVSEIAAKFGISEDRVRKQFAKNALRIESVTKEARRRGATMLQGVTVEHAEQCAKDYAERAIS